MAKILFLSDKWCGSKPELGLANHVHYYYSTLSSYGRGHVYDTLHYDESIINFNQHIDEALEKYCNTHHPDIIFYVQTWFQDHRPSKDLLGRIRDKGIKTVVIYSDTSIMQLQEIDDLADVVSLQLSIDHPMPIRQYADYYYRRKNHVSTWTPQDSLLYYPGEKTVDTYFPGSFKGYQDRHGFVNYINEHNLPIVYRGGQHELNKLSYVEYANSIRQSKIAINFPMSPTMTFCQAKGKIFEFTACMSLLMDVDNPCTSFYFEPNKEYVPVYSFEDIEEKRKFYLNNPLSLQKIAEAGYNKFKNNWTSNHWWDNFFSLVYATE